MMRIGNNSQGIWQLFSRVNDGRTSEKNSLTVGHRKETIVVIPSMTCVPDTLKILME